MKSICLLLLTWRVVFPVTAQVVPATATTQVLPATEDLFIVEEDHAPIHLEEQNPKPTETRISEKEKLEVDVTGMGPVQIFRMGNEAYEKEEYEQAIAYYESLLDREGIYGDLYYNLANAYFRVGDFGYAALYYEKARKLRPRDPDIRHNLDYTRTFLIDKEIKSDRLPGSLETLLILHRQTTLYETLWILACLSALVALLGILKSLRIKWSERVLFGYLKGIVWTLFLLQIASVAVKIWIEEPIRKGVILSDSTSATSAPGSDKQLLEINSGTRVEILDIRNGYAHIRLPTGVPAYIPHDRIGEI